MKGTHADEMLEIIYPLENAKQCRKRFQKKMRRKLLVAGAAFGSVFLLSVCRPIRRQLFENRIARPENGSKRVALKVTDGMHAAKLELQVNARKKTGQEAEEIMEKAALLLPERIRGENASLLAVMKDLNLVERVPEYDVDIVWDTSKSPLIRGDGTVWNKDLAEAEDTAVDAIIQYGGESIRREYPIRVCPYPYSEAELFENGVREALKEEAAKTESEDYYMLPQEISGRNIKWEEMGGINPVVFAVLGILALALIRAKENAGLEKKIREREEQLLIDYPEFLSKFLLLLRSGMNARSAWERMIEDYRTSGRKRFVYDEMVRAMMQMEIGLTSESGAYEQFGRRCALLPYLRFTTILNQNQKKGAKGIAGLLQAEAKEAFLERKQQARRQGEEAGTKLLIPMGGMLIIVLAIILIPAFASFY